MRRRRGVLCVVVGAAVLLVAAAASWWRVEAQSQAPPQSQMSLPAIDLPKNVKPQSQQAPAQAPAQPDAAAGSNAVDPDAGKPEIARQAADLLKMAKDLKAAVDKSTKDELSLAVVRKSSEIEQLAHKVRSGETARADTKPAAGP